MGRLYYLSQLGAEPSSAYALLRVKGQVETLIRNSGVPYTVMRCGTIFGPEDRFVNGVAMLLRTNPLIFLQPGDGENLLHPLYVKDLVAALEHSLQSIDLIDAVIEIGGAEYVTFNEMVRTVMRVRAARDRAGPAAHIACADRIVNRLVPRWPMTMQWFDAGQQPHRCWGIYDYCGVRPVRLRTRFWRMPGRHYGREPMRSMWRRAGSRRQGNAVFDTDHGSMVTTVQALNAMDRIIGLMRPRSGPVVSAARATTFRWRPAGPCVTSFGKMSSR